MNTLDAVDPAAPPAPDGRAAENGLALLLGGALAIRLGLANHPIHETDAIFGALFALIALGFRRRSPQLPRAWLWWSMTFGAVLCASAWASPHPFVAALAIPSWLAPAWAFSACALLPRRQVPRVIACIALACSASALVAWYQRWVLWPQILEAVPHASDIAARLASGRPLGLSLSPDLGGALALLGLQGCGVRMLHERGVRKWPFAVGGALCGAGMIASASAGVALAFGVLGSAWGLLWLLQARHFRWRNAAVSLLVLAPVVAVGTLGRGAAALSRSMEERLWNWWVSYQAFLDHPLLGFGPGRFAAAYAHHRVPEANVTRYAHSTIFHALVEIGTLGVVCLLIMGAVWLAGLLRMRAHAQPERRSSVHLMLAGCLALGLRCAFDYDGQISQTACGLMAWCGLTWAYLSPERPASAVPRAWSVVALAGLNAAWFMLLLAVLHPRASLLDSARLAEASPSPAAERARLQDYAAKYPGDIHIAAQDLKWRLEAYRRCAHDCAQGDEELGRWVSNQLQAPLPPPPFYVASVRLAWTRGDLGLARAQLAAGLKQTPGDLGLRALSILMAETEHARAIAEAEALRWQARERLEQALLALQPLSLRAPAPVPTPLE